MQPITSLNQWFFYSLSIFSGGVEKMLLVLDKSVGKVIIWAELSMNYVVVRGSSVAIPVPGENCTG